MKKALLLTIVCSLLTAVANPQAIPLCEGKEKGAVWSASCCKCSECLVIESKPRMPGDCRDCHLLCKKCRTGMGDLNQAIEKLKSKNRELNQEYQRLNNEREAINQKFYKAFTNFSGEREGSKGLTLDGLYGSFGSFSVSLLSLASNFTGTGPATRIVNKKWFGVGMTLFTNGAGIYQTASGRSSYDSKLGVADEVASWTGIAVDFVTTEFWHWLDETIKASGETATPTIIQEFLSFKGYDVDRTPTYGPPKISPEDLKAMEKISILSDAWALTRSSLNLANDLKDIVANFFRAWSLKRQLEKILNEILSNNDLMACIKETQDELNKGGLGFRKAGNIFPVNMAISFIVPTFTSFDRNSFYDFPAQRISNTEYIVDEVKIESAISRLQQLITIEKQNQNIFTKKIVPAFFPWITNKWKNYEPRTLVQKLQATKAVFQDLIKRCDEMVRIYQLIKEDLQYAVIYENQISDGSDNINNSPLSEYIDIFYLRDETGNTGTEKWRIKDNNKIPADKGRLNLIFPANVEWSVDIYTADNKFFTNRSSYSKHSSYSLAPGNYKFILNSIPVENVRVEKGKETFFKSGILNIVSRGNWELYDESKKTYYTSGNKPTKRALPVGTYLFNFGGKDYRITIRDGMVLKFDYRKPFFVDQ